LIPCAASDHITIEEDNNRRFQDAPALLSILTAAIRRVQVSEISLLSPIDAGRMSNIEPSAIVRHGIACIGHIADYP